MGKYLRKYTKNNFLVLFTYRIKYTDNTVFDLKAVAHIIVRHILIRHATYTISESQKRSTNIILFASYKRLLAAKEFRKQLHH